MGNKIKLSQFIIPKQTFNGVGSIVRVREVFGEDLFIRILDFPNPRTTL